MTKIVRSAQAEEDLIDIWMFIAISDQHAADRVLDGLEKKTMLLVTHPFAGRNRSEIAEGARSLVSGSYLILYRLREDRVEIVRYIHMKRRLEGLV